MPVLIPLTKLEPDHTRANYDAVALTQFDQPQESDPFLWVRSASGEVPHSHFVDVKNILTVQHDDWNEAVTALQEVGFSPDGLLPEPRSDDALDG